MSGSLTVVSRGRTKPFSTIPARAEMITPTGAALVATLCKNGLGNRPPMAIKKTGYGFGSREFREAQARMIDLGPERFLATLTAKTLADVDEWQTQMQLKPMRVGTIQLYTTGLDADERRITGVELVPSLDAAVADSIRRHGDHAIAVIPEGPYVIPVHG